MKYTANLKETLISWYFDWNLYAKEALNVTLDKEQREALYKIQHGDRIAIKSGHSRGKDFLAAVAAICFLTLSGKKTKVICTAPTGRQAISIMMSEISSVYANAKVKPGGELLANKIKFENKDKFLIAFKAGDKATESWTGFHSPNIMIIITEASGINQQTYDAIEGLLTGGNSKLLLVFNPNRRSGEIYRAFRSNDYETMTFNCLNAPNVQEKKLLIPGQVDYKWVKNKIERWCLPIKETDVNEKCGDFEFEDQWYSPNDLFRVKVLGIFPEADESSLVPLEWIEAANNRWYEIDEKLRNGDYELGYLKLGIDVAGMGVDLTTYCLRYNKFVKWIDYEPKSETTSVAGRAVNYCKYPLNDEIFVDTVGLGEGVYNFIDQQEKYNVYSVKAGEPAKYLSDFYNEREFVNMKAYLYWKVRECLDPRINLNYAIPPIDELTEELTEVRFKLDDIGKVMIEKKEDTKERLGRSPDYLDSLANTFYPGIKKQENIQIGASGGR